MTLGVRASGAGRAGSLAQVQCRQRRAGHAWWAAPGSPHRRAGRPAPDPDAGRTGGPHRERGGAGSLPPAAGSRDMRSWTGDVLPRERQT